MEPFVAYVIVDFDTKKLLAKQFFLDEEGARLEAAAMARYVRLKPEIVPVYVNESGSFF
jgi:hypothetical protein